MTISEVGFALEQAEIMVENRNYDEWARAAYISANILNANSGKKGKKYTVDDLIKNPRKEREKKAKQKRIEADNDTLRQLALDKGLKPF
jgi:hypothetical protein